MNQKKKKTLVCLAGILILLLFVYAGIIFFQDHQEKGRKKETEAQKIYVTDLKGISDIQYDVGNGLIHLTKEDNVWYNGEDHDFPLAQSYPKQMEDTLEKLQAERKLEDGDTLEDYGLQDPVYTVTLTDTDGKKTTLYFGNTTGDSYYLTLNEKTEIYTVKNTVITDLAYTMEEMAQLDVFPAIGSGNLKKVTVLQNGKTTVYDSEKEEDETAIEAIAGGLGAVILTDVAEYSAEQEDLAQYGLDEKSRIEETVVYTQDTTEKELTVYLGKEDGNGARYLMLSDSKIVYRVESEKCRNMLNQNTES